MSVYEVKLGDVILDDSGPVTWVFETGGQSPFVPLIASQPVDLQLQAIQDKELALSFKGPGESSPLKVERLGLVKRGQAIEGNLVRWTLADRRYRVGAAHVDVLFNQMIRTNEKLVSKGNIDPNIAQLTSVPKLAFVPEFCRSTATGRDSATQRFATGKDDQFEPWTALTALRWLLSDEGFMKHIDGSQEITEFDGVTPFQFGDVDFSGVTETKILLRNWNPRTTWANAVNTLLKKGRYMLYLDPKGKFVVRNIVPSNAQFNGYGSYRGAGGLPIKEDVRGLAPRKARIRLHKRYELRLDYHEQRDFSGSNVERHPGPSIPLRLKPVVLMPNEAAKASGVGVWQRGQYVHEREALAAWDKHRVDKPDLHPKAGKPWTIKTVNDYYLHQGLANALSNDHKRKEFKSKLLEARVAALYQYHRKAFQIPQELIAILESISADSVEIIDPATGRRQVNSVICDYIAWDSFIHPTAKNLGSTGKSYLRFHQAFNSPNAPESFKWEDGEPSPFRISIEDSALGIIRIEPVIDFKGMSTAYDAGLIDIKNIPSYRHPDRLARVFPSQIVASPVFRLSIKISVRFRSNSEAIKFLDVVEDDPARFGVTGARGRERVKMFQGFEAGYRWKHGQTLAIDPSTNQPVFSGINDGKLSAGGALSTGGDLVNENTIRDIAESELTTLYFDYLPRVIGSYAAQGWTGAMPQGQVDKVMHGVYKGVRETVLTASRPPAKPSVWEFYEPETRNLLGRFTAGTMQEGAMKS